MCIARSWHGVLPNIKVITAAIELPDTSDEVGRTLGGILESLERGGDSPPGPGAGGTRS